MRARFAVIVVLIALGGTASVLASDDHPKDAEGYATRGYERAARGDHKGAIADFDEAIKLDPKTARFFADRARSRGTTGDHDGAISDAFGTWVEKSMYGRKYMGIERATFLFDAQGLLVQEWRKVKVPGHAQAVLAAAKAGGDATDGRPVR